MWRISKLAFLKCRKAMLDPGSFVSEFFFVLTAYIFHLIERSFHEIQNLKTHDFIKEWCWESFCRGPFCLMGSLPIKLIKIFCGTKNHGRNSPKLSLVEQFANTTNNLTIFVRKEMRIKHPTTFLHDLLYIYRVNVIFKDNFRDTAKFII